MKQKCERNSSIELLRIIAIMGVIILHYNNSTSGGGFRYVKEGSINQYFLFLTENLFIGAVDLFILISAYFLCTTKERRLIKVVELNVQVIIFRIAGYILSSIISGNTLSIKALAVFALPVNYFVILYSVLYIVSPYINVLIENISKKDLKKLIIIVVLIFSVWTIMVDFLVSFKGESFNGLSTVGMYGSQYGYSIVNFVMIYVVGAYIRINEIKLRKGTAATLISVLLFILYVVSIAEHKMGVSRITTWNYNNPLIILLAASTLLLFLNFSFNSKIINELARGAFTCFLFHGYFITGVHIKEAVNSSLFVMIFHQICVVILLYLLSYVVYRIYALCTGWIIKILSYLFDKIDISLE